MLPNDVPECLFSISLHYQIRKVPIFSYSKERSLKIGKGNTVKSCGKYIVEWRLNINNVETNKIFHR